MIEEQQRKIEEKYGPVSVREVDTSWAKGFQRRKSADEGEKRQVHHEHQETTKKNQTSNRKVVNASELFKIVIPGHEGREGRKRREPQERSKQRKEENIVDTDDKESFPSLTGN